MTTSTKITNKELIAKIPLREENDKGCPNAKEGEHHYLMWDTLHKCLRCGTCYARALVLAGIENITITDEKND